MIQTMLACPKCSSPHQQKLEGNKFRCGSCQTEWFREEPEIPAEDESPEAQEEPVMVVKPASIKAGEFLQAKGYLTGQLDPYDWLGNWWYLGIFEKRPPKTVKGFLGRPKLVEQQPRHLAQLVFDRFEDDPNHWVLKYWGDAHTQEITTLARELAANLGVKIYAILESK